MGIIQDEWSVDAVEILNEIPKAVTVQQTFSGTPIAFNVLMSPPMVQQDLTTGGFLNSTSYDLKFLRADAELHSGLVAYGNLVNYNGNFFRISAINNRPPSAWIICKVESYAGSV
jgi:hypothetical protein